MTVEELEKALEESKAETAACLKFLANELEWECFRIDQLFFDDIDKLSASENNARRLKNFLLETGHGIALLRELHKLRRAVKGDCEHGTGI